MEAECGVACGRREPTGAPRPQARVGRVGALCGALTSLWALAAREGRFGRMGRWTMTESAVGVCGLSA